MEIKIDNREIKFFVENALFLKAILVLIATLSIFILWSYSIASDFQKVVRALESKDKLKRLNAIAELSKIKAQETTELLTNVVFDKSEDWKVKIIAIRALGEINDPEIVDKLVTIFNNPFLNEECPAIKLNTALSLGKKFNRGTRAVDSLIEALNQDNLLIKEAVIEALGEIGDPKAVPSMISLLEDENFAIKISAIRALEKIGDSRALPFLEKILELNDDILIQQQIIYSLEILKREVSN